MSNYCEPTVEVIGSLEELTLGIGAQKTAGTGDFVIVNVAGQETDVPINTGSPISVSILGGS
ncbi:MAG TPA: hypothetical protein VFN61_16090 [Acidimicrobiales bacterium]|nr:hypothetical protein [Acidimicrobiales bacterium]